MNEVSGSTTVKCFVFFSFLFSIVIFLFFFLLFFPVAQLVTS